MAYRPFPFEEFHRIIGGSNWVLTNRRTRNIVERYGDDVICLSARRYEEAKRQARMERYGTDKEHY